MEIPKDFIGAVIGPGGKMIQLLQKESETTIVINEKDEDFLYPFELQMEK